MSDVRPKASFLNIQDVILINDFDRSDLMYTFNINNVNNGKGKQLSKAGVECNVNCWSFSMLNNATSKPLFMLIFWQLKIHLTLMWFRFLTVCQTTTTFQNRILAIWRLNCVISPTIPRGATLRFFAHFYNKNLWKCDILCIFPKACPLFAFKPSNTHHYFWVVNHVCRRKKTFDFIAITSVDEAILITKSTRLSIV